MNFLADAHVSHLVVAFIQSLGHDCTKASYLRQGLNDEGVLEVAVRENRVLITADKDFGELVFRDGLAVPGVLLMRLRHAISEQDRVERLRGYWQEIEAALPGHFVTVDQNTVRCRPLE
ncbi:MAG TPA: DUF5615 family PIN-like protein [Tepidisphaeraceae bacterium]